MYLAFERVSTRLEVEAFVNSVGVKSSPPVDSAATYQAERMTHPYINFLDPPVDFAYGIVPGMWINVPIQRSMHSSSQRLMVSASEYPKENPIGASFWEVGSLRRRRSETSGIQNIRFVPMESGVYTLSVHLFDTHSHKFLDRIRREIDVLLCRPGDFLKITGIAAYREICDYFGLENANRRRSLKELDKLPKPGMVQIPGRRRRWDPYTDTRTIHPARF